MVVRRRTDVDLDAVAQVVAHVRAADDYPTYLPGDDYHRFLTRPEPLEAWVSEWDARICGHVALNAQLSPGAMQVLDDAGIVGPLGAIARLLVDPDVRGRGIARLLQTARSAAVTQHRVPVLEVVESSHAAKRCTAAPVGSRSGERHSRFQTGVRYGSSSSQEARRSIRRYLFELQGSRPCRCMLVMGRGLMVRGRPALPGCSTNASSATTSLIGCLPRSWERGRFSVSRPSSTDAGGHAGCGC